MLLVVSAFGTPTTIVISQHPSMPPINRCILERRRVICYRQTFFSDQGAYMSMLPLVHKGTGITHLIMAAIHLNEQPGHITLNDDSPSDTKFNLLWAEVKEMQDSGLRIMGMLGGAARGSFKRLDGSDGQFEAFYGPLLELIQKYSLDGLDLDTEEQMSPHGISRLIDRLKNDLGDGFIINWPPLRLLC